MGYTHNGIFLLPKSRTADHNGEDYNISLIKALKRRKAPLRNSTERFKILSYESLFSSDTELVKIVQTFVILHNVLVSLRVRGELDDKPNKN